MTPSPPGSGAGSASGSGSASGAGSDSGAGGRPPGGRHTASGFISRYQILEKIGEGGMGALFLARDPAIDRLLAIKLLRRGFDTEELRGRFAREAKAAGRLRHPNIVTIFDVGEHEGDPFIAMEFLAGETLDELIRHGARLSLARRLKLLEELCDGLSYAHRAGIVHRDVKPANLIVDSEGILKILDFGIVRFEEGGSTAAGMLVGTVNYMSPEQVSGSDIDHRSDIFAVGLVAYELLTSRQAFPGTIKKGLLNRILNVQYEPLQSVLPQLDPEAATIVEQALQREPADRYQDLAKMRNDLQRARQRIEAMEERAVEDMTSEGGETALVTAPGFPTPIGLARSSPALHAAERALENGEYRKALTLAGRSAASDPADRQASGILARAEAALLDRGRSLESGGGVAPAGPRQSSGVGAPSAASGNVVRSGAVLSPGEVSASGTSAPQAVHPLLWAVVGAVVILVAIAAGALGPQLLRQQTGDSTAQGSTPSQAQQPPVASPPPQEPAAPGNTPDRAAATAPPRIEAEAEPHRRAAQRQEVDPRPQKPGAAPSNTAAAPPASPAAPSPARAGRDVPVPRRTSFVDPQYPASALESGARGTVKVEITIARDGRVADARVLESVRGLDEAALAAVKRWEFAPSYAAGAPVAVLHVVDVEFTPPARPAASSSPSAARPSPQAPVQQPTAPPPPTAARETSAPPLPAATSTRPDPAAERSRIQDALRQWEAAWEARDAAAVARVQQLSAEELARVRGTLGGATEYSMNVEIQNIRVDPDGRHAAASCVVSRRFNARVGGVFEPPAAAQTFTLERRGDGWIIVSVR